MGIFQAIQLALAAFVEASKDFKLLVASYTQYQDAKWREALNAVTSRLEDHTVELTSDERKDLAKKLADLTSRS